MLGNDAFSCTALLQFMASLFSCSLAGVSRSVTLVVAYIMTITDFGWEDALSVVRAARSCANPNMGFQRQLQDFEKHDVDQVNNYKEMSCETQPQVRSWTTSHCFVALVVYLTPCFCFEGVASWPSLLHWGRWG